MTIATTIRKAPGRAENGPLNSSGVAKAELPAAAGGKEPWSAGVYLPTFSTSKHCCPGGWDWVRPPFASAVHLPAGAAGSPRYPLDPEYRWFLGTSLLCVAIWCITADFAILLKEDFRKMIETNGSIWSIIESRTYCSTLFQIYSFAK